MTNDGYKGLFLGILQGQLQPLALGASTTETTFSVNGNNAANPVIAAAPAILKMPDTALAVPVGGGTVTPFVYDNGRPFFIQAWGVCTTGTTANLTIKLYQVPYAILGTLAVGSVTGCNLILASSARAVNTTTGSWLYQAELQWNSTSKLLTGSATDTINSGPIDAWAATNIITTTAQDADLNFIVSATLSAGNAANVVTMQECAAQQL